MGSARIQGELWGKSPRDWTDLQEPMHQPLWEAMLNAAQVKLGTRFLDAGCGGGGAAILAHRRGAHVTGVDAAAALINIARERVPEGDFHTGDIEDFPFADGAFDVAFAANSIQYTADRLAALRELKRISSPEGRLVAGLFSVPEKVQFRVFFKAVRDTLPEPPPGDGPFGLSREGVLEGLIEQAGFRVIDSAEVNCPFQYEDFEALWKANVSAGPVQGALRSVSADTLKANVQSAVQPFQRQDGSIYMDNAFRYVVAEAT